MFHFHFATHSISAHLLTRVIRVGIICSCLSSGQITVLRFKRALQMKKIILSTARSVNTVYVYVTILPFPQD